MSIAGLWWRRICEPLDGFLWRKGIDHPIIRPTLRNEIMASGLCVLGGGALYAILPWLFWFGCGLFCMCWIFWSWAGFFARIQGMDLGTAILRAVIINFLGRLLLLACLLYVALAIFKAPAPALLAGLVGGGLLALASYAINSRANG